jgi:hypothetical protein
LYAALGLVSGVSRWWPRGRALLGTARDRLGAPRPPKWPLSPWFLLAGGVVCGIMIGGWVLLLYG